jgi:hypothetical protein
LISSNDNGNLRLDLRFPGKPAPTSFTIPEGAAHDHKENHPMEIHGYMKIIIIIFALAVPIAIATMVYKTLFSGLNSIPSSRKSDIAASDAEKQEQIQNQKQVEKDADS